MNLPLGVTVTGTNLPAYLQPMVGSPTTPDTVEGWNATQQPPYRAPDPDLEDVFNSGFFNTTGVFTKFDSGFNVGFTPTQVPAAGNNDYPNKFNVEYPYIEREFYFTTDNSPALSLGVGSDWGQCIIPGSGIGTQTKDWDYSPNKFKLRIPDRYIEMTGVDNGPTAAIGRKWVLSEVHSDQPGTTKVCCHSAAIRACASDTRPICGSWHGGPALQAPGAPPNPAAPNNLAKPNIFTTTIGRPDPGNMKYTDDDTLLSSLTPDQEMARRIELRPNSNPDLQQLVVGSNGGDPKDQIQMNDTSQDPFTTEIGRDNELIRNDGMNHPNIDNITTPDAKGKARYYQPCVAIPVEGMSVSDPPWGWGPRENQAARRSTRR